MESRCVTSEPSFAHQQHISPALHDSCDSLWIKNLESQSPSSRFTPSTDKPDKMGLTAGVMG